MRLPVTCKALPSRLVRQRISCRRCSREANEGKSTCPTQCFQILSRGRRMIETCVWAKLATPSWTLRTVRNATAHTILAHRKKDCSLRSVQERRPVDKTRSALLFGVILTGTQDLSFVASEIEPWGRSSLFVGEASHGDPRRSPSCYAFFE